MDPKVTGSEKVTLDQLHFGSYLLGPKKGNGITTWPCVVHKEKKYTSY